MSADFTIRTTPVFLDGLFMVLSAVPDLWAVVDSPSCLPEMLERGMLGHAWRQRLIRQDGGDRLFSTAQYLDKGDDKGLPRMLEGLRRQSVAAGRRPGAVLVCDMAPMRLIGNDLESLAAKIQARVAAPVRVMPCPSLTRDFHDGLRAGLEALVAALPDAACRGGGDAVGLLGYVPDRLEADHRADLRELSELLAALGLKPGPIWLSGAPMRDLAAIGGARRLIALPHGLSAAKLLARRSGAEVIPAGMPIGLAGTSRWLRRIARRFGRARRAEAFIRRRLEEVAPLIAPMVTRVFAGRRVAVIAEPALAVGLSDYCAELGLQVLGPFFRCRRPQGLPGAPGRPPLFDPSQASLRRFISESLEGGPVDLVIGTSWEREALADHGLPFLELGFPSFNYRPLVPSPCVGFAGALHLAHRLSLKLAEADFERC